MGALLVRAFELFTFRRLLTAGSLVWTERLGFEMRNAVCGSSYKRKFAYLLHE
jgi:hypothetical protein